MPLDAEGRELAKRVAEDSWQPKAPNANRGDRENFRRATEDRARLFQRLRFPQSSWGKGKQ